MNLIYNLGDSMLFLEEGLYMSVKETVSAPAPYPLKSGFSLGKAYRVIGGYNASESAEAYLILANDRKEIWFISNRHLRFAGINKNLLENSIDLSLLEKHQALIRHSSSA